MTDYDHLIRQWDILPPEKCATPITVIGAGAVGSFVALSLAKMGFENITVWDFDTIEVENMNCQFYRMSDIGKPKVEALAELIQDFTGVEISRVNDKYTGRKCNGIVISAVDSMEVRQLIWDSHAKKSPGTQLIIDPRMSAEASLCYVMRPMQPKDDESYRKALYTDEAAIQERCTAKATMYTVLPLAGHVCQVVKSWAMGLPYARTMTQAKYDVKSYVVEKTI